jgi:predicted ribonuclease YlaK
LDFLHQLSLKQSSDQDALLKRLDEIIATMKATQRQASPRTISDELQQRILTSNWGICAPEKVLIIAPSGDSEAQNLAGQVRTLLGRAGMDPRVIYEVMKKEPGNTDDFKITTTNNGGYCTRRFFGGAIRGSFSVGLEAQAVPDPAVPVSIYVYSR